MKRRDESAAVGDRALIAGSGAAVIVLRLLPRTFKAELVRKGISGEALDAALEAVDALQQAAVAWREDEVISPEGNGEGQTDPSPPESVAWISTQEAAQIFTVSPRRVRQLSEEGMLDPRLTASGALEFSLQEVLDLRRQRLEKIDDNASH